MHRVSCSLLILASLAGQTLGQSVNANIAVDTSSAGTLSPVLSPSYAGMGIEPTNLIAFTGSNTANELTINLLNNLANYTGVPPHLRIGGNSGDNMLYSSDSQYSGYQVYTNPSPTGRGSTGAKTDQFIIGSGYFAALDMLPQGTPITYGLNMAYNESDYLQQIVNQANAALNGLSNVTVVGFEVGNEPDLYVQNNYRNTGYTVDTYGSEWLNRVSTIYATLLQPKGLASNFFEPACTATTATTNGKPYRIANLVTTDVAGSNGVYVAGFNQHDYYYYTGVSTYTLTLSLLLDLSQTTQQFTEWAGQAQQAQTTGKPYYLREMGSVGPEGIDGITNVFGNTLWTFNFFLYAATLQISSVQMHMTQTSYAAPWTPIDTPDGRTPGVRTTYYAWAAIDQIIGPSCSTRIAAVSLTNTPSGYTNRLAAYASYQGSDLSTISMINTQVAYTGGTAGTVDFVLSIPSMAGQNLHLSYLTASGADAKTNTTWNGISYEQSGDGSATQVESTDTIVTVGSDGTVSIPVRDSQAVVASVGSQIGSNRSVNSAACASLSTQAEGGDTNASGTTSSSSAPTFRATGGFVSSASSISTRIPSILALVLPAFSFGLLHFYTR
jgi:hypothetical protein